MNKRERVQAVIEGRAPDHPPVSCWYHFAPNQYTGQAAVDAHLRHLEIYDLDFLKVMNDHPCPREQIGTIKTAEDLRKIKIFAGSAHSFAGQINVIRGLRKALGQDILMTTTIFNTWSTLRLLAKPPVKVHSPPMMDDAIDECDEVIATLLQQDRTAIRIVLEAIGHTLAEFARECVAAGADGVFLSVREDWVNTSANGPNTYRELVRPTDLLILEAVAHAPFNVLHLCGRSQNFRDFAQYPVAVLNWADRVAGPSIAYARDRLKPTLAGGVDNLKTLPNGQPEDCAREVHDALRQARNRPIMITPGCTYDPQSVPPANIKAMVQAARQSES